MRPAADLAVSIEDSPDPVLERDQVTYTVTVDNLGPGQAPNTRLVDTLPANPTFVSATASQGSCERDVTSNRGGVLTCELGTIAAGRQATVTIVVATRREPDHQHSHRERRRARSQRQQQQRHRDHRGDTAVTAPLRVCRRLTIRSPAHAVLRQTRT